MTNDKPIVLRDSPEAATYRTDIKGWVSRLGRFFGEDESTARYDGGTHQKCRDCEAVIRIRGLLVCDNCESKLDLSRHEQLPRDKWDSVSMLYSASGERFFVDLAEMLDHAADIGSSIEDLRLQLCEPHTAVEIDPNEFYTDDLPEDFTVGDVSDELAAAFAELNRKIRELNVTLSWHPAKMRPTVEEEAEWQAELDTEASR